MAGAMLAWNHKIRKPEMAHVADPANKQENSE